MSILRELDPDWMSHAALTSDAAGDGQHRDGGQQNEPVRPVGAQAPISKLLGVDPRSVRGGEYKSIFLSYATTRTVEKNRKNHSGRVRIGRQISQWDAVHDTLVKLSRISESKKACESVARALQRRAKTDAGRGWGRVARGFTSKRFTAKEERGSRWSRSFVFRGGREFFE